MLREIEAADAVVLASPVNYYNVTAIFRRFLERLLGFTYWPWGQNGPALRSKAQPRKAVLLAAAGMPGFLIPLATGAPRALRLAAAMMGAKPVGKLWIGLTAGKPDYTLSERTLKRARQHGRDAGVGFCFPTSPNRDVGHRPWIRNCHLIGVGVDAHTTAGLETGATSRSGCGRSSRARR